MSNKSNKSNDIQLRILYQISFEENINKIIKEKSSVRILNINMKRNIEDVLLRCGLDIGKEPTSYEIIKHGDKELLLYYDGDNVIDTVKEVDIDNINMLKFFSKKQNDSISENIKNKINKSNINIDNLIYFKKLFDIKSELTIDDIISFMIIIGYKSYDKNIIKNFNTIRNGLKNKHFSTSDFDFTENMRNGNCFVYKPNEFLKDYKEIYNKYINKKD